MVRDKLTGDIFRADHLVKQVLNKRLDDDRLLRAGQKVKKAEQLEPNVRQDYEMVLETVCA